MTDVEDEIGQHYIRGDGLNTDDLPEGFEQQAQFVVHPGWAARNYDVEWETERRMDLFLRKFYSDYVRSLGFVMDELASDKTVHVVYEEGGRSHSQTFMEQFETPDNLRYTMSEQSSGQVTGDGMQEVLETIDEAEADEVMVHGELDGRCRAGFQVHLGYEIDSDIYKGVTFPPKPTNNYVFEQ